MVDVARLTSSSNTQQRQKLAHLSTTFLFLPTLTTLSRSSPPTGTPPSWGFSVRRDLCDIPLRAGLSTFNCQETDGQIVARGGVSQTRKTITSSAGCCSPPITFIPSSRA